MPAFVRRIHTASESLLGSVPGALEETALAYLRSWRRWHDEARRGQTGPLLRWRREVIARLQVNLELARPALQRQGFVVSPVNSGPYALAARRVGGRSDLDCVRIAGECGVLAMSAPYFHHERDGWQGLRLNLSVPGAQLISALECGLPALPHFR
jgi:DNA-binding transcriptional MocR family regulator